MWFGRLSLILLTAVYASPARADDNPTQGVRLSFVRAENASGCISLTALEQEIARRMGRNPFVGPPRQWIEGVATKAGAYYEVQLFERDAEGHTIGTRRLRDASGDCRKLDDAIELAIALIIDPSVRLAPFNAPQAATASSTPTEAPGTVQPDSHRTGAVSVNDGVASAPTPGVTVPQQRDCPPVVVPPDVPKRPVSSERRFPTSELTPLVRDGTTPIGHPSSISVLAFADAVLASGILPSPALGFELGTRIGFERMQRWSLRVGGLFLPEQRDTSDRGDFSYGLTALELGLCVNSHARRVTVFGCASPGLGAVHAVVNAPAPFEPGDRLWFAVRAEAGVALQVAGPVWLEVRALDWIAPRRWQFRVKTDQGPSSVFAQSPFMPGAALGLAVKFD